MNFSDSKEILERVHYEVERDILRMQEKIVRFQRKLRHLQDIYEVTKPENKSSLAVQMNLFGT